MFDYTWLFVAMAILLGFNVYIAISIIKTNQTIKKIEEKPLQGTTEELAKEDEIAFYHDKNHKLLMFLSANFAIIVYLAFFYFRHH